MKKKSYPQPTIFVPTNPKKYIGDASNIVMRSGWETKFAKWADRHPEVVKWFSEELVIPYMSPVDGKMHRYFPDFGMVMADGKRYVIEIKPYAQSVQPVRGNKRVNTYLTECMTYGVNQAKWTSARKHLQPKGIEFIVLTERELKV